MSIIEEIKNFDFDKGTISTLLDLCVRVSTKEEADLIIERYNVVSEHAIKNLVYIFGYCDKKDRKKLYALFPVKHPVFGTGFGRVV